MPTPPPLQAEAKSNLEYWAIVTPLFLLSFLVMADHLLMVPLSSRISQHTGLALEKSGLLVSVYPLAAAFSAFVMAPFSDLWGRKKILMVLALGFALSTLAFTWSDTVWEAFFYRILSGIFGGPVLPNALAFAGDCFDRNQRAKALATVTLAFSVSSILGVPLGAWLGDQSGWQAPFYWISAAVVLSSLLLLPVAAVPTGLSNQGIWQKYKELLEIMRLKPVQVLFLVQFLMLVGLFGFVPNISAWLTANYGMTATQIGLCYMQGGIGGLLGNRLASYFLTRGHKKKLIALGSLAMGIFLQVLTLEIFPPQAIGFLIAGVMLGGTIRMPALQLLLTELLPIYLRGRLMSLSVIVSNVSMGLGGVWSIPLLEYSQGRLDGMGSIGTVALVTLALVPLALNWLKPLDSASVRPG